MWLRRTRRAQFAMQTLPVLATTRAHGRYKVFSVISAAGVALMTPQTAQNDADHSLNILPRPKIS